MRHQLPTFILGHGQMDPGRESMWPFLVSMFMIIVDTHSKWLEVVKMASTTTEKTLDVLRNMFARYGLPEQIVSDNGPQFVSKEFEGEMV